MKQQLTKLSLSSSTSDEQFLFFQNKAVKINDKDVHEIHKSEITNYVWDSDICKHDFKRIPTSIEIEYNDNDDIQIKLNSIESHFLRFVINSSRTYWREELENRISETLEINEKYANEFKFSLIGSRLTPDERKEQIQNFCNKIYTIGYLMHSYKSRSKSMGVWIMENKLIEDGDSSGGSGKSFFIDFIKTIKNTVNLSGRNKKLTDNQNVIENVDERTDIINIDDAWQYFDFDFFYSAITGNLTVNGKHTKSKEIDYDDVPKIVITSNFPPPRNDGSTMRRLLLVSMSDYYHKATSENDYQEDRRIADDFGYDLYDNDYKQEYWNQDYNFLIDCLQFYLRLSKQNIIIQPPMDKITARINAAKMGPQFAEWAAVYFSEEGENLDCLIPKKLIYDQFIRESGVKWTTQKFGKAIKAFVANTEYIDCMNPPELRCKDGRVIRKLDGEAVEMYYLKHLFTSEINDQIKGEF